MSKAGPVHVRRNAGIVPTLAVCALLPTLAMAATAGPGAPAVGAPDVILVHGVVLTMNASNTIAEAVAIKGDTIVDVGIEARVKALAGPNTRVIDLEGKTLVPGFIDPRVMGPFGFWETVAGISLIGEGGVPAGSAEEIEKAIKAGLAAHPRPAGAWMVAAGFNPRIALSRKLRRDVADRAAPDNPILILSLDHHIALVNGKAIDALGLKTMAYADGSGEIEKDNGEPTGLLREGPVFLVMNKVWDLLPEQVRREATQAFITSANRFGLTTAGVPMASASDIAADEALLKSGDLSVRTVLQPFGLNTDASATLAAYGRDRKSPDPDRLLIGTPVQIVDGTPIGGGAALFQPYKDARWTSGALNISPEGLDDLLALWGSGKQGVALEASGTLASHLVLDAAERAASTPAQAGTVRPVLRVDGMEMLSPRDRSRLPMLAKTGAVVSVQPNLFSYRVFMATAVGDDQMKQALPYKTLVDAGVFVALSSDWPITAQTFQPMQMMEWAITRTGFRPEEALSAQQSLRAITLDAARALGLQDRLGSIEVGKKADLVVLDRDPLDPKMAPEALSDIAVRMTLLGGEVVYEDRRAGADEKRGTETAQRKKPAAAQAATTDGSF
jgi:predicted amidohydrolase YtcJ